MVVALAGCAQPTLRPDLARMYRVAAVSPDATPVIVVPGLFGSKLRDKTTGVEVWPGDWKRILFSDYRDLALKFDAATLAVLPDNLEAYDIAEHVPGIDFYGPIIDTLARFGGYTNGSERVRKLILLGTPNFGAISAVQAFLVGEKIGLERMLPEVLATMPSGYQLFPHPLAPWLIDAAAQPLRDDLFEPETWRRYRWNVYDPAVEARLRAQRGMDADAYLAGLRQYFEFRLERARRFMWMLSTRVKWASRRLQFIVRQPPCVSDPDVTPFDRDQPLRFELVQYAREVLRCQGKPGRNSDLAGRQ